MTSRGAHIIGAQVLAGGGGMGTLMRTHDWAATPLGAVKTWPQSLRTAVSICLSSRFPMIILWGPDLVQLYNDGYWPILGAKHPRALGQPTRACWPEVWDFNAPIYEAVVTRGEVVSAEDQLFHVERGQYREESYFTLCYSPIRDESGSVGGVLVTVLVTTRRVLGERRLRTLRDLAARPSAATTVQEACTLAAQVLAGNAADLPFALIYLLDATGTQALLAGQAGVEPGTAASPATISLQPGADTVTPWPVAQALRAPHAVVVTDLTTRGGVLPVSGTVSQPRFALIVPIMPAGQAHPLGVLVAGISPLRALDDDYRGFVTLIVQQVAASVIAARILAEQRHHAEERTVLLAAAEEAHAAEVERGRLQTVFQQSPALIALLSGPEHVVAFVNTTYEKATGRSNAALQGRPLRAAFPEVEDQRFLTLLDTVYTTGTPFIGTEVPVSLDRHGDGGREPLFFSFIYQALRDAAGAIEGILVHGVEVTEQVQARRHVEEIAARLDGHLAVSKAIMASMGEGVYTVDRAGRLTFINPAAEEVLGWTAAALYGRDVHEAIHVQHADGTSAPAGACPLLGVIHSGVPLHVEDDVFTHRDGRLIPVSYTSSPIVLDGQRVGAVVAFHNIRAAKDLERAREEFLSSAAHDLKTPLTAIHGNIQLAQRRLGRVGTPQTDAVATQLARIEAVTQRMTAQIDELEDVAHARLGLALSLDRQPSDLVALVRALVAQQAGLTEHMLTVAAAVPVLEANIDSVRVARALGNLISNAIKYSPAGGSVMANIRQEQTAGGPEAIIRVSDEGVGIPASDLPHIFTRFHRSPTVIGRFAGTGVGLASVWQIVQSHGGSVSAESREGAGSTFTVRLPL